MEKTSIQFHELSFKLAIIQELMYEQKVLQPAFDVYRFAETYRERSIEIDEEGYDVIPEVLEYFQRLEIPHELAPLVTSFSQDSGNEVYLQLCPFWDGEDDGFNIRSARDADHFPNLKNVALFYDEDDRILNEFEKKGIQAEWL